MANVNIAHFSASTGGDAWGYMEKALKFSKSGVGGGMSFFAPMLFVLMEREYRASPNKKKAILLWELFLQGNYGTTESNVMRPDPNEMENIWVSLLQQNVEAGGGIPEDKLKTTAVIMQGVKDAYNQSTKMGSFTRWRTSSVRKIGAVGGEASATLFQLYIPYFGRLIEQVDLGKLGNMDELSKKIYNARPKMGDVAKKAGFTPARIGLSTSG